MVVVSILQSMKHSILWIAIVLNIAICSCRKDSSGSRGCTNRQAYNYDSTATIDDGTCICLSNEYSGQFLVKTSIYNLLNYQPDSLNYVITMARLSPLNNIITLSNFHNRSNYTASFIVNEGVIVFPKQQFSDPGLYILSAADGSYYGTPYIDPAITLIGDTLTFSYEYQEEVAGTTVLKGASAVGVRIH